MSDEQLVEFELSVALDAADEIVMARVAAGEVLACNVDASDVVSGLNNNDDLLLAFIKDILRLAGSSELEDSLLDHLTSGDDPQ